MFGEWIQIPNIYYHADVSRVQPSGIENKVSGQHSDGIILP